MDLSELDREIGEVYARRGFRVVEPATIVPLPEGPEKRPMAVLDARARGLYRTLDRVATLAETPEAKFAGRETTGVAREATARIREALRT